MNTLEILGPDGDVTLSWDPDDPDSVGRAHAEFDRLKEAGYLLFTVRRPAEAFHQSDGALSVELVAAPAVKDAGSPAPVGVAKRRRGILNRGQGEEAEHTREFDKEAPRTVAVPPMRGGAEHVHDFNTGPGSGQCECGLLYGEGVWWLIGRVHRVWMERRPTYCDRGHWIAHVEPVSGSGVDFTIDNADLWPRFYMDFDRMVAEVRDWLAWRESDGPAMAGQLAFGRLGG